MRLRLLQGWARIVAHFVDAAEKANFSPDEINRRLRQLAETTVLDEFWITDEKGHAYLRNIDVDFTFSPSALEQPQAHVFWPLLLGKKDQVIQEARRREIDDQHFKYAGVSGTDKARIVEVGYNAKYLNDLKARVGLGRAVQALLASGDIDAIWVFDKKLGQLAGPEVMGPASARFPSEPEMQSLKQALGEDRTRSVLLGSALSVIAPIKSDSKNVIGAALVRIPTERMWQAVQSQLKTATIIALAVLGMGFVLSLLLAKHQVAPIEALTAAATSVKERKFESTALAAVTARPDNLITRETWSLVKDAVIAKEMPPLTVKGIGHPVQVYELLGVKDSMPTKVIRRNIDGMQITIELGRGDKKQTVQVLKELIAEIDFERNAIKPGDTPSSSLS